MIDRTPADAHAAANRIGREVLGWLVAAIAVVMLWLRGGCA